MKTNTPLAVALMSTKNDIADGLSNWCEMVDRNSRKRLRRACLPCIQIELPMSCLKGSNVPIKRLPARRPAVPKAPTKTRSKTPVLLAALRPGAGRRLVHLCR